MSNEEKNQELESAEQPLTTEQKVVIDRNENPEAYKADDAVDTEALVKKKNDLLNEKKKEQQKNRQLQDELNALKAALQSQENEKLEEKQEYKTLWENTQKEKEEMENKYFNLQDNLVKEKKIKQFDKTVGASLSKDRYYDFVDLGSIIVNDDGSINKDSVKYVVNLFRENYPELTPKQNFPKVGAQSASNGGIPAQRASTETSNDRKNARARLLRGN
jgi:hypothetical protein